VREIFPILILLSNTPVKKISLGDRFGVEVGLQYSSKR